MRKLVNASVLNIIVIIIISLPALIGLFHQGFFVTDDGEWMIIRFSAFYQAFADGQIPVRFLHRLNFDFGYPVATFLYPGFMYAGIPFHLLKIELVETIKILFGFSLVGTTLFTYFWLHTVFKAKLPAVVGAITSLYLPYHLYDVYTRGSLGEVFALLWIPFILWMIEKKQIFFISIGIFLLILSHNTLALLFLPLLFLYALLRKAFFLPKLFLSFFLGLSLSAFFIIPAIVELSLTKFAQTTVADPTKYFADISLIGVSSLIIFIIAGGLFIFQKKSRNEDGIIRLFLLVTFLAAFLSSSYSEFVWKIIPSTFIQFPFRLLSLLIISIPFIAAFCIFEIKQTKKKVFVSGSIILILIITSYQFLMPKEFTNKGEGFYSTNEATTTVQDEYMPLWVKEKSTQRPTQKVTLQEGEGEIANLVYNNKQVTFTIIVEEPVVIRINTLYWPGWKVLINNTNTEILYNNPKGLIEFKVSKGKHQVKADFSETPLRIISDFISLVSLFLLILFSRLKKI